MYVNNKRGSPRGVMVKAMHCGIVVSGFVLQPRYYVHFRVNTLENGMNTIIIISLSKITCILKGNTIFERYFNYIKGR